MMHDELLAELNTFAGGKAMTILVEALRAVVEIHTPEHSIQGYHCVFDFEDYPCFTIQKIGWALEHSTES
jgi:hypothetical protein